MDKNQYIGLILMFAVLGIYFTWFAPDPPAPTEEENEQVSQQLPTPEGDSSVQDETKESTTISDSAQSVELTRKFGAFSFAASGEEETQKVENEDIIITFSSKGGKIKEVILKNHFDYRGRPFKLVDASKSKMQLLATSQGKQIDFSELNFKVSKKIKNDTTEIIYSLSNDEMNISQSYLIPKDGFLIKYDFNSKGLNNVLEPKDLSYQWNHGINLAERTLDDSRLNANVRYYQTNEEYDELSERSNDYEESTLTTPLKWVSFKQKFFTSAVIADKSFNSGFVNQKVNLADTTTVKEMSMNLAIPYSDFANGFGMTYYFGTNKYSTLKKITPGFEENLDMGWGPLPLVNKFLIIPIFNFLQGFIGNYGLIIVILVVFIRLILSPLTYKSHMSMAKMRAMKPELDELKKKHDGDMQKQQQEQMKLYQQVGINPLSGCIPMLLQMPILFSLFFFFPNAVDLRGQSFLWAKDLSTYDSIINLPFEIPFYGDHVSFFTLLMTITTIMTVKVNSQTTTTVEGPMKTVQYVMPIMFLFVLNNYASGLTFYYFVSNMATLGQTMLFKRFIDEDKIHQTLQENKKKNATKGKSKFQQRLEDAMKASQEAQRNKKKKK